MNKLRYLTDAAMTTAITIAVLLLSHVTGMEIEELFPFLLSIPTALYTIKHGFRNGLIPCIAVSALSLLHNPIHSLLFVMSSNVIGLVYGGYVYHSSKHHFDIAIAMVGSLIVNVLTLVIFSKLLYGYTILEDVQNRVQEFFMKVPTDNLKIQSIVEAMAKGLIPSILVIISVVEGWAFHFATTILASRIYNHSTENLRLPSFKMPRAVSFIYVLLIILSSISLILFENITGFIKILWIIMINIVVVVGLFYLVYSMLFFASLARKKGKPIIYYLAILGVLLFPIHVLNGVIVSLFQLDKKIEGSDPFRREHE